MVILESLKRFFASSIGKKIIVAVTGLGFVLFLIGHLAGNLLMYVGPDAMNTYATTLHDKAPLLWVARIGLIVALVLHVAFTVLLKKQNLAARRSRYAYSAVVQTSLSTRIMIWSGLTILVFLIYHLLHFTFQVGNDYSTYRDATGRPDVYRMVIEGFRWIPATLFYLLGMTLLCSHLGHGVASIFQTLGLATDKNWPLIKSSSHAFAILIYVGFISIPISVLFGIIP
ncbi:hypothetical protein BH23VER1_BH23VER1_19840 [soil metagenome]